MVGLNITVILLLVLLNGVLSMTELAIVSARHGRLQQMAENGNKGAATAAKLGSDPSRFLSTVQIGITLIGIANGAFGGATLTQPVAEQLRRIPAIEDSANNIAGFLVVVVITYLSLVIGELVPKRLALQHPEAIASVMAPLMNGLSTLFKPIVWFLGVSNDAVLALMRIRESDEPAVTEDEIRLMLMQATDAGVFERAEQEMVAGVFGLGDRTAGELMTPRHAISWLDIAEPDSLNIKTITEGAYSNYPVIDDEPDNVVGVVSTRDILKQSLAGEPMSIRAAMTPALFVPEILPVLQVLRSMRDAKTNLAIVIDEYGGFEGLITDNDVIRGLVDEIGSGDANGTEEIEGASLEDDGTWLLDGQFAAHEFRDLFDVKELDGEEAGRFETIAGYILDRLGHIPVVGESVEVENLRIEVVTMDGYRIDTVRVTPLNNNSGPDDVA
ncbi:MAG: hemolysin family protein [Thermomicrobiales bacterium]|nr:hemolysin family protein [Thermomicrobiales bacterium]MCO5228139.1 hemolysin family protein [Thermomicrobiales bacterium]